MSGGGEVGWEGSIFMESEREERADRDSREKGETRETKCGGLGSSV
jgi:hypothetical protein